MQFDKFISDRPIKLGANLIFEFNPNTFYNELPMFGEASVRF
jgi:hypothetical protein